MATPVDMQLYSLHVFRKTSDRKPSLLASCIDMSSFPFYQRTSVKEIALFVSREIVARLPEVEHKNKHQSFRCFAGSSDDICAAVTTNEAYPSRIALECVLAALKAFKRDHPSLPASRTFEDEDLQSPQIQRVFGQYLKPENDKILMIQRDIEDTKVQLKRDIELLLERGEKLEVLIARSEDLSWTSRKFLDESEKLNRCCALI